MTHPNVSLSATNTLKPFTDIHSLLNGARFKRKNQLKKPIAPGEVRTHDLQTGQHPRHMGLHNVRRPRRNRRKKYRQQPVYYDFYDY